MPQLRVHLLRVEAIETGETNSLCTIWQPKAYWARPGNCTRNNYAYGRDGSQSECNTKKRSRRGWKQQRTQCTKARNHRWILMLVRWTRMTQRERWKRLNTETYRTTSEHRRQNTGHIGRCRRCNKDDYFYVTVFGAKVLSDYTEISDNDWYRTMVLTQLI